MAESNDDPEYGEDRAARSNQKIIIMPARMASSAEALLLGRREGMALANWLHRNEVISI